MVYEYEIILCRNDAEEALQKVNGSIIGKQTVRLSWGRNPANKQQVMDSLTVWFLGVINLKGILLYYCFAGEN